MPLNRITVPIDEYFWERVDKTGDCWVWTRGCTTSGYGEFMYAGKMRYAHRTSWEIHFGPIPDGMQVCHHCDNRKCVRPDHLFLGTNDDNIRDMRRKRRHQHGDRHWKARLTEDDVREMRSLHPGVGIQELADRFGVSYTCAYQVIRRYNWKHVP